MATQRLWPTVQAIGRTIVYNRPEILQQGVRAYNHHNVQIGHNFSSPSLQHNFEERLFIRQDLLHKGKGSYLKVVSKKFSTGVQLFCREFSDGENEHAHDVLRSLPAYKYTTIDTKTTDLGLGFFNMISAFVYRDRYWPSIGTDELVHTFVCISKQSALRNLTLEDQQYHRLCLSLIERVPYMSDDQLLRVLSALSLWPPTQNGNTSKFDILWKALDEACFKRLSQWDISKIFLVADHWYALRISKLSIYFTRLLNTVGSKIHTVTPTQLVQYMFYVNLNRDFGAIKKYKLEKKINEALEHISIEELGIIAMALFKTQTQIENFNLLECIIQKMKSSLLLISDHSLGSILKLVNRSFPGNAHNQCYDLLETLTPHLHRFNTFVLLQVALLGNNLLVFHEGAMQRVGARFGEHISELRLKDIERFTYSLMLYKFIPSQCPDILDLIVNELRKPERIVEINHFPKCFISCVNYLVAMGVFHHDLISAALQPSMVQLLQLNSYDDQESAGMGREVNELDWALKIEVPSSYLGYTLEPKQSISLTKNFMGRIPSQNLKKLSHQEKFLLDVQAKLSAMMGEEGCVEVAFILPNFFNPDLVFCTTNDGRPVPLPNEFRSLPWDALKPVHSFQGLDLLWNAVMVAGRNSIIRETKALKGSLDMKKRQLAKLGYKVSVIPYVSYIKSSIKNKLNCLEMNLQNTASLSMEGRRDIALSILKPEVKQNEDNVKECLSLEEDSVKESLSLG